MSIDNSEKPYRILSSVLGFFLFLFAAFVAISALLALVDPYMNMFFARLGIVLVSAYGYSSLLIPLICLWAAILLLIPGWSMRSTILLGFSWVLFFTVVGGEKILGFVGAKENLDFLSVIVQIGVLASLMLALGLEVILILYVTDLIELKLKNNATGAELGDVEGGLEASDAEDGDGAELGDAEGGLEASHAEDGDGAELGDAEGGLEASDFEVSFSEDFEELTPTPISSSIEVDTAVFDEEDVVFDKHNYFEDDEIQQDELDDDIVIIENFDDEEYIDETDETDETDEIDETYETNEDDDIDEEVAEDDFPEIISIPPSFKPGQLTGTEVSLDSDGPKLFSKQKEKGYSIPFDILTSYPDGEYWVVDEDTRKAAAALKDTLNEFKIEADVTGIRKGPVITMFEILPAPGVKLSKIVGLQDNIALRLAASSVRIVAPIPGKHAVGIEVPNQKRSIVSFRELIESDIPQAKKMEIPVVLGKDITGEAQLLDLASTPHLLIAGSTGSGKSVCVNSIILSILYKRSPEEVKLLLIDPKIVELKLYNDIGHLLSPVITEPKKAFQALQYCLCEMERRYALLDGMGVRDIRSYNRKIKEKKFAQENLPYLVVIIDEFADLMATTGKELESTVARLCAMSRAVGIHLVLATQRPSIDVITGLIKANIPSRIAFMVASKMDSRIIIDQVGAEKLLGRGDMLYASAVDPFPVRIQGAFVSEEEVENVVECVKKFGEPEYIDEEIFVEDDDDISLEQSLFSDGDDPLYDKALEIVLLAGKASASYIQRRLKIGYNRAARLVEEMEARGIVGPANGSKPRDVLHHP